MERGSSEYTMTGRGGGPNDLSWLMGHSMQGLSLSLSLSPSPSLSLSLSLSRSSSLSLSLFVSRSATLSLLWDDVRSLRQADLSPRPSDAATGLVSVTATKAKVIPKQHFTLQSGRCQ